MNTMIGLLKPILRGKSLDKMDPKISCVIKSNKFLLSDLKLK